MMKNNFTNQKAFGLIQLLVVIAASGLLSSVVVFSVSAYRGRIRDTKRLSDLTQIRQGLEFYLSQAGGYPDTHIWNAGAQVSCFGAKIAIPKDPAPWLGYAYQSMGTKSVGCGGQTVWSNYKLGFETETDSVLGPPGSYCLQPAKGIIPGQC
jgi:type II secretory pathway pseudopilin PulG